MSVAAELLKLIPDALELVGHLAAGDTSAAERKAKVLAQALALKQATQAAAKIKP